MRNIQPNLMELVMLDRTTQSTTAKRARELRMLADLYAAAKLEYDEAGRRLEMLRQQILDTGECELIGTRADVYVRTTTRQRLNCGRARSFLTEAELIQATDVSEVTTVTVERRS